MDKTYFKQKSLILARQLYPTLDGDFLIQEAERIFTYLSTNNYQNFIGLNLIFDDILSFTEMLMAPWSTDKPLTLYEYQRDLLSQWQTGADNVVVHGRSMGITMLLCIYALWLASFKNDVHIGIVCPNTRSGADMSIQICEFHNQSNFKLPAITKYNRNAVELANGNKIRFLTPSTYMVGISFSHVFADNASAISFADDENFYSTIMFANSGQSLITGTPGFNVGIFYDMVSNPVLFKNQKTFVPYGFHPDYSNEWERKMRAQMGNEEFENQFNCEFKDAQI